MATLVTDIIRQARANLREVTPRFWTDEELEDDFWHGARDLWGAVLDVHGEHYLEVDEDNVSLAGSATQLTGVPNRCFRVQGIEPLDATFNSTQPWLRFVPRKYNSPEFAAARALGTSELGSVDTVFYAVSGEGSPIAAPVIRVAPAIASTMSLRLLYNPTLEKGLYNPIPGESDMALKAWVIAYARAKETESNMPDPSWLSIYATEKQSILTRIVPRQEQEPEYVAGMFEGWS
jgi:hypothetical protein